LSILKTKVDFYSILVNLLQCLCIAAQHRFYAALSTAFFFLKDDLEMFQELIRYFLIDRYSSELTMNANYDIIMYLTWKQESNKYKYTNKNRY
jgi:hypothetical protein